MIVIIEELFPVFEHYMGIIGRCYLMWKNVIINYIRRCNNGKFIEISNSVSLSLF